MSGSFRGKRPGSLHYIKHSKYMTRLLIMAVDLLICLMSIYQQSWASTKRRPTWSTNLLASIILLLCCYVLPLITTLLCYHHVYVNHTVKVLSVVVLRMFFFLGSIIHPSCYLWTEIMRGKKDVFLLIYKKSMLVVVVTSWWCLCKLFVTFSAV